jgi:hypothetical protein
MNNEVRRIVYDVTMHEGMPPSIERIAAEARASREDVAATLHDLAAGHVLVLQANGEILMAPPFSAVPTSFVVRSNGIEAYGNCIWDALGIPAMLGANGTILCSCGDCGEAAEVIVENGAVRGEGLMHFAVPARLWWKDIVFT